MVKKAEKEAPPPAPPGVKPHPIVPARRAGVPIVAIETADPAATIRAVIAACASNGKADTIPIMEWDLVRALRGCNKAGVALAQLISPSPLETSNPVEFLDKLLRGVKEGTIVFIHNAQRILVSESVMQGVWNLRDAFKVVQATVILLGPTFDLPAELKNDIIIIEEPVPGEPEIATVIEDIAKDAGQKIDPELKPRIIDTLLGLLSLFHVEQSFAMSVTKTGVDMDLLWDLKVNSMKSVAGLDIMLPKENFSSIAGVQGAKAFLRMVINGRRRPRVVCFMDEVEKALGGATSDLSGTTQALLEQFLYWTEQSKVDCILLTGIPGAGKSATARAVAGECGVPLAKASMSTVKGSLVGQSEANMNAMLKAISAIGQGRVLLIATSNNPDGLPPEVMARFKLGQFFYDLCDATESAALWVYYRNKYGLNDPVPLGTEHWVGREIESCCDRAWLFGVPLVEAAQTIVPIYIAQKDKIESIRKKANNRYLSASKPGPYVYAPIDAPIPAAAAKTRTLNL